MKSWPKTKLKAEPNFDPLVIYLLPSSRGHPLCDSEDVKEKIQNRKQEKL
jgi:hypothetical protein